MYLSLGTIRLLARLGDVWAYSYMRTRADLPDAYLCGIPARMIAAFGPVN